LVHAYNLFWTDQVKASQINDINESFLITVQSNSICGSFILATSLYTEELLNI